MVLNLKILGDIEKDSEGRHRCYVFYCDPYASNQKGKLEKNHEFIRHVIPKGKSMQSYIDKRIPALRGQFEVSPDDVLLKPELLVKLNN